MLSYALHKCLFLDLFMVNYVDVQAVSGKFGRSEYKITLKDDTLHSMGAAGVQEYALALLQVIPPGQSEKNFSHMGGLFTTFSPCGVFLLRFSPYGGPFSKRWTGPIISKKVAKSFCYFFLHVGAILLRFSPSHVGGLSPQQKLLRVPTLHSLKKICILSENVRFHE